VADLSAIVQPGTPISSLLTGVLGIQPQPTLIEAVAWLIYLIPMLVFVLWPVRRPSRSAASATAGARA
jgi:high-affinity iron transporter